MPRTIFNKKSTLGKRRDLKKNQTKTEQILWSKVRNRQVHNIKFRRQFGIGKYIVDFYSAQLKLVIEIDGPSHFTDEGIEYDKARTNYLQSLGLKVIRFTNDDIYRRVNSVIEQISKEIEKIVKRENAPSP